MDSTLDRVWSICVRLIRSRRQSTIDNEIILISRLISSLKAGQSLDSSIEQLSKDEILTSDTRAHLVAALEGKPNGNFLFQFLSSSLKNGMPAIGTLTIFQKALQSERKLRGKAQSMSSQCRAQGEALSWLPWFMGGAVTFLDFSWAQQTLANPVSWLLFGLVIFLTGVGKVWMRALLSSAFEPTTKLEKLEEISLPELLLRLISEISAGMDCATALENSLHLLGDISLNEQILCGISSSSKIEYLKVILREASHSGAPLREELLSLYEQIQQEKEVKWEEKVQRLPVIMLAPLFLCFFPGSLLVLLGFFYPLFRELL